MTAVSLTKVFNDAQFFDNNGHPLNGGRIYSYQANSNSIEQPTYVNNGGNSQNTNPIILDSSGRPTTEIWLDNSLQYHLILTDNQGSILEDRDNVTGSEFQFITMPGTPNYLWGTDDGTTTAAYATDTLTVGHAKNAVDSTNAIYAQHLRDSGIVGGDPMTFSTSTGTGSPNAIWGSNDNINSNLYPLGEISVSEFNNDVPYAAINSPSFSGTPQAPTPTNGTNNNQLATTAFVQAAVASSSGSQSLTTNGYKDLPGGLIMQWGSLSMDRDTEKLVTYPKPFPNQVFIINATANYDGNPAPSTDMIGEVRAVNKTNFYICRAAAYHSSGTIGIMYWFAIGY